MYSSQQICEKNEEVIEPKLDLPLDFLVPVPAFQMFLNRNLRTKLQTSKSQVLNPSPNRRKTSFGQSLHRDYSTLLRLSQ